MDRKQKLELTWIGKYDEIKVEPRILLEDKSKGYGDPNTENMLIHGDNLLALKALEQDFAGKIKCIYIDPPYNTGSAFTHYDDNLEHSTWLNLMKPRLELLRTLLSDDGFLFVQIDDNEQAYLRVILDEIFGRKNFIATFIWVGRAGKGGTASNIAYQHEYIHCYGKTNNAILKKEQRISSGGNFEDEISKYKREQLRQWGQGDRREDRPSMWYPIIAPDGTKIYPYKDDGSEGRWRVGKDRYLQLKEENLIDIVKIDGQWKVYRKIRDGRITETVFGTLLSDMGTSATGTSEIKKLFGSKTFDTPKPEKLIEHLIMISTNEGDLVLDSFLGSGTTAAVAHKMGRRWIGIELGDHCYTHCLPRLKAVVDGEQGGISKAVNWQGGGGFRFFELAPSLLKKDKYGNWIIDERYNADMLAAAMAKHQGFTYAPDSEVFWKQGYSFEKDYIFTTTQFVTLEYLDLIHQEMAGDESLLICCKAFQDGADQRYENINVKKIPQVLLNKCDFGVESYSLNIVGLPEIDEEVDDNE